MNMAGLLESDLPVSKMLCAYFDGLKTRFVLNGSEIESERVFSKFGFLPVIDYVVKCRAQLLGDIFDNPICQTHSSGLVGYRLNISKQDDLDNPTYKYLMLQAAEDLFFDDEAKRNMLVNLDPVFQMFVSQDIEDRNKWVSDKL